MTAEEQKNSGYITLKEAGERFGYSADYIGQLIRKGKLEGKQVYANVAWMTTPEAMEEYLAKEGRAGKAGKEKQEWSFERLILSIFDKGGSRELSWVLYTLLALLSLVLLIVFYFLSVTIDHRMEVRAKERLLENSQNVSAMVERTSSLLDDTTRHPTLLSSLTI